MAVRFINNWSVVLLSDLLSDATSITVNSADAIALGTIAAGDHYVATLTDDISAPARKEIIHITGVSGNVLTVERGKESTNAAGFFTGDLLMANVTAGLLGEFVQGITPDGDGDIVITDAEQTITNKRLNNPKINEELPLTKTATELNGTLTSAEIQAAMEDRFLI
jgi:hypothetical protein